MSKKYQSTGLNQNFANVLIRLELWVENPWRRYSLLLILFFGGFVIGTSLGMINGVLALMDNIGAFFVVALIEIMIRLRSKISFNKKYHFLLQVIDSTRIGLIYGLFMEGFKLL
tara:strand:+ start:459 stop:800 length:342 start_codon:yes stop_codon:yes gene_type:complete